MTPNPKIAQERVNYPEANDYPRFTPSMARILVEIQKFKEAVRAWRN